MKREEKAAVVEELAARITESQAIYAADYRGITVSQAAQLRAQLRESDATFRIVKNTLTLLAADKAGVAEVKELVEGPTAFTFVQGDPAVVAKALDAFSRRENVLALRGGVLDGQVLTADALKQLARLPSREQLTAQFAGVVASPITGLVRGLGSMLSGLAIALGQVRDRKQAEPAEPAEEPAEAPAAEAPAAEEPSAEEPAAEQPAEQPEAAAPEGEAEAQADDKEAE